MTANRDGHLDSTISLIAAAFPDGIEKRERLALIRVLYDHMSDRNLARVVAIATSGSEEVVLNEVYEAAAKLSLTDEVVRNVADRLHACGFAEWLNEDAM